MYQVIISRIAEKQLASFPKLIANNITAKIDSLSITPRPVGSKKLEGSNKEYRIWTGDYRIIYRIEDIQLIIEVIRIGHRRDVYRKK
jgi:mRNA interferase RelE/StbE